ncbi:MAG: porin PorA family protein [Streptosporangiaceae bacterium]
MLVGLGSFLIVMALALPSYVLGQVIKFPLSRSETVTLTGTGMSYFSPARDAEVTGADIRATDTVTGDPADGSSSVAAWSELSYVYDTTNNELVQVSTRTFGFDRRTAQLVRCRCANVDGNSAIAQAGLAGPVFPIGAKPTTYDVFDTALDRPEPFGYGGTADVDGIETYRFVENVPPTRLGYSPLSSTQPEYATIRRVYLVDPATGMVLSVNSYQKSYLTGPATGALTAVLYGGDLQETPASVRAMVRLDAAERNKISLLRIVLPIALGAAGAAALIAGIVLARRPRREAGSTPDGTPVPAIGAAAQPG